MNTLQLFLIVVYLFLIACNYWGYTNNIVPIVLTLFTVSLSTFLLFASNTADLDWSVTQLDMSGYRSVYESYDALEHPDFRFYYLFYECMHLGQSAGLSFRLWWGLMSIMAMTVIFFACKIHNFSYNLFLATFMAYYELVFYSGFKFFYGFCFLLLAYGFLLRNTHKGRILFVLFTCIAGGFHVMYYLFIILLFKPIKHPRLFVSIIVIVSFVLTLLMRASGSAVAFFSPLFDLINNEHFDYYTSGRVHLGFYLALFIHIIVVFIAYKARQYKINKGQPSSAVDALYYTVLVSLLFCPLYGVALTFMRFITAFSLVVVTAGSSILTESRESRSLCTRLSIFMVLAFHLMRFVTSFRVPRNFYETSVMPFFDVF